jgi:ribosomal protein S18 acetylase RimI-like enzyme
VSEYHFSNALNYTHIQLSQMHNASFQGYFVPMEITAEMSADFWRVNQIDATRCVIMHDTHGAFVGMARIGSRDKRGWCGGFGIVPQFRGTGASVLLADQMLRVSRESGLKTLQLEVLRQNTPAIKLYEKVGFTKCRRLFGVEIASAALPSGTPLRGEKVEARSLLSSLPSDQRPFWGYELASLLTMDLEAFVSPASTGGVNGIVGQRAEETMRVVAVLLQSDATDLELATLLRYAAGDARDIQVYNEAEESPCLQRYLRLGFAEFFSQYEMMMNL